MEFGQRQEWNVWDDLQWELLEFEPHKGIRNLIDDLNVLYKNELHYGKMTLILWIPMDRL